MNFDLEQAAQHYADLAISSLGYDRGLEALEKHLRESGRSQDVGYVTFFLENHVRATGLLPTHAEEVASVVSGDGDTSSLPPVSLSSQVGQIVADVKRERIRWLWPGRLALGKLAILDGDPGTGKSTLYCDLAARLTTGRPWPDDKDQTVRPECVGGVVIVTVEDAVADTIRPRLEEAGADLRRVNVVQTVPECDEDSGGQTKRVPTIPKDLDVLEQAVKQMEARLLIIDPLFAHLGLETRSHNDQHVRAALSPLAHFAEHLNLSVLVVRHLNKMPGGSALYRGGGSIGIIGQARLGLLLGRDPDEERLVLAVTKTNIAKPPASLALRVVSSAQDKDVGVVQWEGVSPLSAQDLVARSTRSTGTPKLEEAKVWLTEQLAGQEPRRATEMWEGAEAAGLAKRTVKRAQEVLGVVVERIGGLGSSGGWYWALPEHQAKGAADVVDKELRVPNTESGTLSKKDGDSEAKQHD